MKDVIKFLKANGFKRIEKNHYANEMGSVVIEDGYYAVADNEGWTMYSKDLQIYWLIGVLTYHGYIPQNYKK